jgi:tellurite resistance protein TehA-like permease
VTGTEAEIVAGPPTETEPQTEQHPISSDVRTLFPGYFAMVMATGIIAIGASQQEIAWLADALYAIAAMTYPVLAVLLVWRAAAYPRQLAADITSHAKGFAFLTTVAATNVLGSASAVIHGW